MGEISCTRCHGTGRVRLRRPLQETLTVLLDAPMPTRELRAALPGHVSLGALNMRLYRLATLGLAVRLEGPDGITWRRA